MRHFHVTVADGKRTRGALCLTEESAKQEAQIEREGGKDTGPEQRKAGYETCNADCFLGKA